MLAMKSLKPSALLKSTPTNCFTSSAYHPGKTGALTSGVWNTRSTYSTTPVQRTRFLLKVEDGYLANHDLEPVSDCSIPVCITPERALCYADQDIAASKALEVMDHFPSISIVPITFVRHGSGQWIALHG